MVVVAPGPRLALALEEVADLESECFGLVAEADGREAQLRGHGSGRRTKGATVSPISAVLVASRRDRVPFLRELTGSRAHITLLVKESVAARLDANMSLRDAKLTIDDYQSFPDDGKRHEIIDGEHYVTPAPNLRHQAISRNLTVRIGSFLLDHPLGRLFAAPCDVYLSRFDVVEPDLLFVSSAKNALFAANGIQGAPDLVIEILSPGTRKTDERTKRDRYARFGVREYWIMIPSPRPSGPGDRSGRLRAAPRVCAGAG